MTRMTRMWINQPSTLQPHHGLHGTNVLVDWNYKGGPLIYFLSGPVASMVIHPFALSRGWR